MTGAARTALALEIPRDDIVPSDGRAPDRAWQSREVRAAGNPKPPLAGFIRAAGNVGHAVAVEVAGNNVVPENGRTPGGPKPAAKRAAGGLGRPPLTGFVRPTHDISP